MLSFVINPSELNDIKTYFALILLHKSSIDSIADFLLLYLDLFQFFGIPETSLIDLGSM